MLTKFEGCSGEYKFAYLTLCVTDFSGKRRLKMFKKLTQIPARKKKKLKIFPRKFKNHK